MSSINTPRVIGAGLLAGVVWNLVDFGVQPIVASDMQAMVTRLGLAPEVMQVSAMIPWVAVDLALGMLIVLNYAAMRTRFGPGPKTALLAGFIIYASITVVIYGFTGMGIFDRTLFVKYALCGAVATALASLAGGWAYKES